MLEVDGDRALVAVAGLKQTAIVALLIVVSEWAHAAEKIPFERLDFDHVSTMIAKDLRAEWSCQRVGQVKNPQALEGAVAVNILSPIISTKRLVDIIVQMPSEFNRRSDPKTFQCQVQGVRSTPTLAARALEP